MARLEDCARGADMLVVQGGINDIAQGRPVEDAADQLRAMVRRGKELGLRVVLVDLLPWNNGWPGAEPQIRRLNALIAEVAQDEIDPEDASDDEALPPETPEPVAVRPAPPRPTGEASRRTALAEFTALATANGDDFSFRRR